MKKIILFILCLFAITKVFQNDTFKFLSFFANNQIENEKLSLDLFEDTNSNQENIVEQNITKFSATNSLINFSNNSLNIEENIISPISINGVLQWKDDDGKIHPLEYVYVMLYTKEFANETVIDTTYTDKNGYYSFIFQNEGLDIFIKAFPAGENISVLNDMGLRYCWMSDIIENNTINSVKPINATFTMDDNLGRAFQISQACILASRYVKAVHGSNITSVKIIYPHKEDASGCFYRRSNKTIYIKENLDNSLKSYASWDVIMHEYGHHVSYEFDICDSPGGWHSISIDMADHYRSHIDGTNKLNCDCTNIPSIHKCKDNANQEVWCEAWATAFSIIAQQFDPHPQIKTVSDTFYTSYNTIIENLELPCRTNGESVEAVIQSILWDIFDSSTEEHDELSLGHQLFWKITTESKAKTFPQFMEYFNENINNVEYISLAAKINANYNIAPRSFKVEGDIITTTAPTFTWSKIAPQSPYYNVMVYRLVILDGNLNRVYESPKITENSYTIPQQAWNSILETGNVIYATVYGGDNSPGSGSYCSEWLCFKNPNESITFNTYHRLIERTISLEQGEYADFYITFEGLATYDRVIQTFGNIDTTLTLFDENGNQIAYDDNNGYENNAQILLKQQNGKKYKIRVKFKDSSASGTTKLIIFIAKNHNGLEPTSFDNFLEISDSAILSTYMQEGGTYVYKFIPSESRLYTITTEIVDEENIQDMYLYLIDPRSTLNIVYDDDGGLEESQARIRINLEAGVPYLLIITRFNPDTSGGPAIVRIT